MQLPDWAIPAAVGMVYTAATIAVALICAATTILVKIILHMKAAIREAEKRLSDCEREYANRERDRMWEALGPRVELPNCLLTQHPRFQQITSTATKLRDTVELVRKTPDTITDEENRYKRQGACDEKLPSTRGCSNENTAPGSSIAAKQERRQGPVTSTESWEEAFWNS